MRGVRAQALPAFTAGLRAAAQRPGLVLAIWAWQLVVAAAASLPLFRGLLAASGYSPGTDPLLERFSVSLFGELLQYNALPVVQLVQMTAVGVLLVSVVTAPVLVAVTVASLEAATPVPRGALAASAGRWYWPFLRLLTAGRFVALMGTAVVAAAVSAALNPVRASAWELGRLLTGPVIVAAALPVLVLLWATVDYAAIHAMRAGSSRMLAAWRVGVRAAFGRPLTTLGIYGIAGVIVVGLAALLVAVLGTLSGSTTLGIAAAMVAQQLFVIFRVGTRVGLIGGEAAAWRLTSVRSPEEHEGPRQDRERQVEQREEPEHAVERQEVQDDRAEHGDELRDREARSDTDRVHVMRDERVPFADAERHHAQVGEHAVEHLGAEEEDDHDVAEPGRGSPGRDD